MFLSRGRNIMKKLKIGLMLLVPVVLCCSLLGFAYCKSNNITFDSLAIKYENYKYNKDQDEMAEKNYIPEDCGYDDVGGSLEEQDEYATNNYHISDVNNGLRNYLINIMNKGFGYKVGGHIRTDISTNDVSAVIIIYLDDIKTTEDRNIGIRSAQGHQSDFDTIHDCVLNTYDYYGFSNISNLDLRLCDHYGNIIMQSNNINMDCTDKVIDLGL